MKSTTLILLMIATTLVSCGGKGGGGPSGGTNTESESMTLDQAEEKLSQKLLSLQSCNQRELLNILVLSPGIGKRTLRKLDLKIDINCNGTSGICQFSPKG